MAWQLWENEFLRYLVFYEENNNSLVKKWYLKVIFKSYVTKGIDSTYIIPKKVRWWTEGNKVNTMMRKREKNN